MTSLRFQTGEYIRHPWPPFGVICLGWLASGQDGGVNSTLNHCMCCVTSKKKRMMRTLSQGLNNNNVRGPGTKDAASRTAVPSSVAVNVGTSTEGLCGNSGSCCPAPSNHLRSDNNVDIYMWSILNNCISNLEKAIAEVCTDRRLDEMRSASGC